MYKWGRWSYQKYILSNWKTVIWGWLLRNQNYVFALCGRVITSQSFDETYCPQKVGQQHQTNGATTQNARFLNSKTGLEVIISFSTLSFLVCHAAGFAAWLAVPFVVVFFVFLASDLTYGCGMSRKPWRRGSDFNHVLLRNTVSYSFCVCRTHARTYTYIHTQTFQKANSCKTNR